MLTACSPDVRPAAGTDRDSGRWATEERPVNGPFSCLPELHRTVWKGPVNGPFSCLPELHRTVWKATNNPAGCRLPRLRGLPTIRLSARMGLTQGRPGAVAARCKTETAWHARGQGCMALGGLHSISGCAVPDACPEP